MLGCICAGVGAIGRVTAAAAATTAAAATAFAAFRSLKPFAPFRTWCTLLRHMALGQLACRLRTQFTGQRGARDGGLQGLFVTRGCRGFGAALASAVTPLAALSRAVVIALARRVAGAITAVVGAGFTAIAPFAVLTAVAPFTAFASLAAFTAYLAAFCALLAAIGLGFAAAITATASTLAAATAPTITAFPALAPRAGGAAAGFGCCAGLARAAARSGCGRRARATKQALEPREEAATGCRFGGPSRAGRCRLAGRSSR